MLQHIKLIVIVFVALLSSVSSRAQSGSVRIFKYGDTTADGSISLERNAEHSLISPYKKDSLKIPTRTIKTTTGKYIFKLNHREKQGVLKTSQGDLVATISLDKKNFYSLTTEGGIGYSFKKLSGNQWNYYQGDNPILVCSVKKEKGVWNLEFVSANDETEGLETLIVVSQVYGVDRIAAKKQSGIMWGTALGLGLMNALIASSTQ